MTIAQEWWDRKSMGCLWPHCRKGSYSVTTTSVNKNNGSEDTFRVFHCFYCNIKSLLDFVICHTEVCTSKEEWHNFQLALPHTCSPQQGANVLAIRVQHCSPSLCCYPSVGRESRTWSRVRHSFSSFSIHSIWNLVIRNNDWD